MGPDLFTTDALLVSVGERIRAARERSGHTLEELAALTGLSKAHLSRLESAERQPSLAALLTVARELAVSVSWLLGEESGEVPLSVHRGDEQRRELSGLHVVPCSGYAGSTSLEALRIIIDPDRIPGPPARHRGEEWLHVLKGTLRLEYDGDTYRVPVGSSVHFDADRPHRLGAEARKAEVLLVVADAGRALPSLHR